MNRILLPYDGSPAARKALETAAVLAQLSDAAVTVLGIVPPSAETPSVERGDRDDLRGELMTALGEARRTLASLGVRADAELLEGEPARVVERRADDGGFDAVVVGSCGFGPVRHTLTRAVRECAAIDAQGTIVVAP